MVCWLKSLGCWLPLVWISFYVHFYVDLVLDRFCLLVGSKKFVGLQLADFCLSSFCFLAGLALSDGEVVEDFQKVMQVSKELR